MLDEIGIEGQRRLSEASVLIVGLGGLGCPVALYLAGAGVGRIGLCDDDTVDLSNLHRQLLYDQSSIGQAKAFAAHKRLAAISHDTEYDIIDQRLDMSNAADIIGRYDIVIDCCDNYATRYMLDDVCTALGKPWIYGSIGEFDGCVSTFMPGAIRYSDIFPDREALCARPKSSAGVVGAVAGIIGSVEAAEAIKLICGFGDTLSGKILSANIKTLTFNTIEI